MAVAPLAHAGGHEGHAVVENQDHSRHKPQRGEVRDGVNGSLDKGQRCGAHCRGVFQAGDMSVADRASKVHEVQVICGGFSCLPTASSTHVNAMAAWCEKICDECKTEMPQT